MLRFLFFNCLEGNCAPFAFEFFGTIINFRASKKKRKMHVRLTRVRDRERERERRERKRASEREREIETREACIACET